MSGRSAKERPTDMHDDLPSLWYSRTHEHRSIGYRNIIPHPLTESTVRLMYVCVYDSQSLTESPTRLMCQRVSDNRDNTYKSSPSPFTWSSLTHTHLHPLHVHVPHDHLNTLMSFGFLSVWPELGTPSVTSSVWPLGLYVIPTQPSVCEEINSLSFNSLKITIYLLPHQKKLI